MINHLQLLEKLTELTQQRDLKRLENSLLKTVDELFSPIKSTLVQLNNQLEIVGVLHFPFDNNPLTSQPQDLLDEKTGLLVRSAVQNKVEAKSKNADDLYMIAIPVSGTNSTDSCLVLCTRTSLSATEHALIHGCLHVYKNFCSVLLDVQTDELTGLLNRKTFDESFRQISSKISSDPDNPLTPDDRRHQVDGSSSNYWIAVIDIDHFKRVNDTFGHIYGDEVLILMSRLMEKCFRSNDLLFRFGGEEFVVITRCGQMDNARAVFKRLLGEVSSFDFPQIGQVTISIGVVRMQPDTVASLLLDQADQALYHAKEHGRNQVQFYNELIERRLIETTQPVTGSIDLF